MTEAAEQLKPARVRRSFVTRSGYVASGNPDKMHASALGPESLGNFPTAHEGARGGRRLGTWGLRGTGPNLDLELELVHLRDRCRDLVRNNSWAKGAEDTWVANAIGTGLVPRWNLDDKDLQNRLARMYRRWTKQADADGRTTFAGLQELVARTLFSSGESLARMRPRRLTDGLRVPLQIQVMEPDHLDGLYGASAHERAPNGNDIIMGVEFDRLGRRRRYWLTREHPGEFGATGHKIPVPARDVLHVFRPRRPGQVRGIPEISAAIVELHELDKYSDAELVRKRVAALFAGFITSPEGDGAGLSGFDPDDDEPTAELEPGTLQELSPGQEINFSNPADVGTNYLPWIKQQLREVAKGMGLTYEQLTGDLESVNFTSLRYGMLDLRRRFEMLQQNIFAFQFCQPVTERWVDTVVAAGLLGDVTVDEDLLDQLYDIEWIAPGYRPLDPVKETRGEVLAIQAGLDSRSDAVARRGQDVEEIDRKNRKDLEREREQGLSYETNLGPDEDDGEGSAADREDPGENRDDGSQPNER